MKAAKYIIAGALFLSFGTPLAHASITNLSSDPFWAEGAFKAFCTGYNHSFQAGKHYTSTGDSCTFSLHKDLTDAQFAGVYMGVVGSSTLQAGDIVSFWYLHPTLVEVSPTSFFNAQQDEDYFFAVYPANIPGASFNDYLTGATTTLPQGMVEGQTYDILRWKWGENLQNEHNPVVVLPGILGSWEKGGEWVLDPVLHTYDNFIDTLLANGYEEGKTLFKFPYDWKRSNVDTAALLGAKIQSIKQTCNCSRVDVVAHSMGGLVAAQYIESGDYKDDVSNVFFVGTPFGGSVEAYKTWEAGKIDFDTPVKTLLMRRIFDKEAHEHGFSSIFSYIQSGSVSSVQQLLPTYPNYLKIATSSDYLQYPNGYPQNVFLEDLAINYSEKIYKRVQAYVVTGNTGATSTTSGFLVKPSTQLPKWEHGEPIESYFDKGDGTVLEASAASFSGPDKELVGFDHSQIVSTSASYIYEKLNGKDPETIIGKVYGFLDMDLGVLIGKLAPSPAEFKPLVETLKDLMPIDSFVKRILVITLFSPIDMQVIAPDGKRLGTDFTTNQELHEIPNAVYSGPNAEHEYAIILNPLPGEYKVQTIGTGNGAYTIAAGYATAATTSETLLSGTAVLEKTESSKLIVSATTTVITLTPSATSTPATSTPTKITPATCVADMKTAYLNKWIPKKVTYTKLTQRCQLLKKLFTTRDKLKAVSSPKAKKLNAALLKATNAAIRRMLDGMDTLAKEKSIKKEGRDLITKNTTWFRAHEL